MRAEIHSLTALRFVAALWVFLFHVDLRWSLELPRAVEGFVQQGACGMCLFFILSGFVLGHNYAAPGRKYLWSRFARVYPVYTLAALVTIPFFSLNGDVSVGQVALAVVADVFMLQAWFPPLFHLWNFGASWSLSAEAFFYGLFPLVSGPLRRLSDRELACTIGILYVLCVLPGVAWLVFRGDQLLYYFMPIFRLPEFLIGVCVAVLHGRGFRFGSPRLVAAGAAAALFACASWMGPRTGIFVTSNAFAVPLIALVIAGLAQVPSALAWRPLGVLGHSSYAFYSMQPLVLAALIVHQRGHAHWNAWAVLGGSFVVLTALAIATHYFVEEPCRLLLLKQRAGGKLPVALS